MCILILELSKILEMLGEVLIVYGIKARPSSGKFGYFFNALISLLY